jgi:hypothetical protein
MQAESCSLETISGLIFEAQQLGVRIDKQQAAIEEFGFQLEAFGRDLEAFGTLLRASNIYPEFDYSQPTH